MWIFFIAICVLCHQPNGSRISNLNQLKIPTAPSKNFPSRKKTDSAHLVCVHVIREKLRNLLANKEQNYVCPFPFCFGFGSTLNPDRNISPFIGPLIMTCAQTQIIKKKQKKEEKPSLPLKFLQQDKKKITCGFFFITICHFFVFCVPNPMDQEYLSQLQIPIASSKNFPSRKKTDSAHLVCVHVFREKKSETLANKEQNYVRPFPFCFGFGTTLDPDNVSPFIGALFTTCAHKIIKKRKKEEEKPGLPSTFLHIWQARNISFRQDKKKTTRGFFFFFVIPTV